MRRYLAEFIWVDGQSPTAKVRSKTLVLDKPVEKLEDIPLWGFDGSSTYQATTDRSDCGLKPVLYLPDPIRKNGNILVLNEVMLANGEPHPSNTRAHLRQVAEQHKDHGPLFGIEQEYTMFNAHGAWPYGWPPEGYPAPQGRYYCGVGSDEVYGRKLVELHLAACLEAGIRISGINSEVMPAQAEFQNGPLSPLEVADQLWVARWLLYRLGEELGISVKLHPKPVEMYDWNGAGAHSNFSTKTMRESGGMEVIRAACERLGQFHTAHIQDHVYGEDNAKRLTGKHETCDINTFRYGVSDRGASVRIPARVANEGRGYLEDRRPAANMDPYRVCTAIIETVCGDGFNPDRFEYFKTKRGDAHR